MSTLPCITDGIMVLISVLEILYTYRVSLVLSDLAVRHCDE